MEYDSSELLLNFELVGRYSHGTAPCGSKVSIRWWLIKKQDFIFQVSKDDRSDVESSSDEELPSSSSKNCPTLKLKGNSHTSDLNGETYDH